MCVDWSAVKSIERLACDMLLAMQAHSATVERSQALQ